MLRLVGQDLVRRAGLPRLQRRAEVHQVCLLRGERLVGAVQVVDQERERRRVDADEAPFDLGLAADLDGGDERDQQRDQPDAQASYPHRRPARPRTT